MPAVGAVQLAAPFDLGDAVGAVDDGHASAEHAGAPAALRLLQRLVDEARRGRRVEHLLRAVLEQHALSPYGAAAVAVGEVSVILEELDDALVVHQLGHEDGLRFSLVARRRRRRRRRRLVVHALQVRRREAGAARVLAAGGARRGARVDVEVGLLAEEHVLGPARQGGELLVDGRYLAGPPAHYGRTGALHHVVLELELAALERLLHEDQVLRVQRLRACYERWPDARQGLCDPEGVVGREAPLHHRDELVEARYVCVGLLDRLVDEGRVPLPLAEHRRGDEHRRRRLCPRLRRRRDGLRARAAAAGRGVASRRGGAVEDEARRLWALRLRAGALEAHGAGRDGVGVRQAGLERALRV